MDGTGQGGKTMSDTPFLSLIIPAWNEQKCLPTTL